MRPDCDTCCFFRIVEANGKQRDLCQFTGARRPEAGKKREGLHNLLNDIATQIANAFYEEMPAPDQFAELCKGGRQ